MKRVAEVIINRPSKKLNRTFSYIIPENLSFLQLDGVALFPLAIKQKRGLFFR